jgi:hypothetical protein
VRLLSWINGGWSAADYTYTASGSGGPPPTPAPSTITSPTPGSTLSGATVTFSWTSGTAVADRYLMVGTTLGGSDIFGGYVGSNLSKAVSGLPTNGMAVHVRLLSWINGGWSAADYTYTAAP